MFFLLIVEESLLKDWEGGGEQKGLIFLKSVTHILQ